MNLIVMVLGAIGPALWRRLYRVVRLLRRAGLEVISMVRRATGVELAATSSMQAVRQAAGGRRE
jgi:hypothetical protein